jgi:hypothetical protein
MSWSGFVVVRLDAPNAAEIDRRARTVTEWLLDERILAPLSDSLWRPREHAFGAWGPGPRWRSAAKEPLPEQWESSPGEEVDIAHELGMYSAMENSEDFACATCGARLPSDQAFGDLIADWTAHGEPCVRCVSCGGTALLGDWLSEYPPAVVGAPGITFYRWPELRPGFVADLTIRLGGQRTRAFWTHG